jgi:hypothetical protein
MAELKNNAVQEEPGVKREEPASKGKVVDKTKEMKIKNHICIECDVFFPCEGAPEGQPSYCCPCSSAVSKARLIFWCSIECENASYSSLDHLEFEDENERYIP